MRCVKQCARCFSYDRKRLSVATPDGRELSRSGRSPALARHAAQIICPSPEVGYGAGLIITSSRELPFVTSGHGRQPYRWEFHVWI